MSARSSNRIHHFFSLAESASKVSLNLDLFLLLNILLLMLLYNILLLLHKVAFLPIRDFRKFIHSGHSFICFFSDLFFKLFSRLIILSLKQFSSLLILSHFSFFSFKVFYIFFGMISLTFQTSDTLLSLRTLILFNIKSHLVIEVF